MLLCDEPTEEGTDPVTQPTAEHRVSILACRDEKVRAVLKATVSSHAAKHIQVGELQMGNWSGVARAEEGLNLHCRVGVVACPI